MKKETLKQRGGQGHKLTHYLDKIQSEGREIIKEAKDIGFVYPREHKYLVEIHEKYFNWKNRLKDFLIQKQITQIMQKTGLNIDIILKETAMIPSLTKIIALAGGKTETPSFSLQGLEDPENWEVGKTIFGVREIKKEVGQKLLTNIIVEISKKLERLQKIKSYLENEKAIPVEYIKNRPLCEPKGRWGFLKFGKYDKKIKIGAKDGQPFKLLQCLTEPFGNPKSVDTVFEVIRENIYNKSKGGIYTQIIDKAQKTKLIQYVIKELQKGKKLKKAKLRFKWDELKTKIWLEYSD